MAMLAAENAIAVVRGETPPTPVRASQTTDGAGLPACISRQSAATSGGLPCCAPYRARDGKPLGPGPDLPRYARPRTPANRQREPLTGRDFVRTALPGALVAASFRQRRSPAVAGRRAEPPAPPARSAAHQATQPGQQLPHGISVPRVLMTASHPELVSGRRLRRRPARDLGQAWIVGDRREVDRGQASGGNARALGQHRRRDRVARQAPLPVRPARRPARDLGPARAIASGDSAAARQRPATRAARAGSSRGKRIASSTGS